MEWIDGPPEVRELNRKWIIEFAGDTVMAAKDTGDTGFSEIGSVQGLRRRCAPEHITRHMEYVPRVPPLNSWSVFECKNENGDKGCGVVSGNGKHYIEWPHEGEVSTVGGPYNQDELRALGIKINNTKAVEL